MATVRNIASPGPLDKSLSDDKFAITPSDSALLRSPIQAIFVGVGGNVSFLNINNEVITLALQAGGPYFLGTIKAVRATGTTATGLTGLVSKALL